MADVPIGPRLDSESDRTRYAEPGPHAGSSLTFDLCKVLSGSGSRKIGRGIYCNGFSVKQKWPYLKCKITILISSNPCFCPSFDVDGG